MQVATVESDARHDFERAILSDNYKMVKYVLKAESNIIDLNQSFRNENATDVVPLIAASQSNSYDMTNLLLEFGAEVDKQDIAGNSSLMIASHLGHEKIVLLLIQNKAKLSTTNELGYTALMYASHAGRSGIVKLLLDAAASDDETNTNDLINKANKYGLTALMLASFEGHADVVKQLRPYSTGLNGHLTIGVNVLEIAEAKGHQEVVAELSSLKSQPNVSICSCSLPLQELTHIVDILARDRESGDVSIKQRTVNRSLSLKNALIATWEIASHWHNLGVFLEVQPHELKNIESVGPDPTDCLRETLAKWLESSKEVTWEYLCGAVKKINPKLSEEIKKKYVL